MAKVNKTLISLLSSNFTLCLSNKIIVSMTGNKKGIKGLEKPVTIRDVSGVICPM
jgi:hypothetical protein